MKIKIKGLTPLAEIVKTFPPMSGDMVVVYTTGLNEDKTESEVVLLYFVTAKHYIQLPGTDRSVLIAEYNDTCNFGQAAYAPLQYCSDFEDNSSLLINYEQYKVVCDYLDTKPVSIREHIKQIKEDQFLDNSYWTDREEI